MVLKNTLNGLNQKLVVAPLEVELFNHIIKPCILKKECFNSKTRYGKTPKKRPPINQIIFFNRFFWKKNNKAKTETGKP
jgi:hypothetical protein